MRRWLLFVAATMSLSACVDPPPNFVEIFVETLPPGATCGVLQKGAPVGEIAPTPGIALVPNADADYIVACRRNGYQDTSVGAHTIADRGGRDFFGSRVHTPSGALLRVVLAPRTPLPAAAQTMWWPPVPGTPRPY
jgi:hypothetical protein